VYNPFKGANQRHLGCLICCLGEKIPPPEARTEAHEEGSGSRVISGADSGIRSVNFGIDSTSSLFERMILARVCTGAT